MDYLFEEIGIPKKYLKTTYRDDRFVAIVHKSWLKSLLKYSKLAEFNEKLKLESWPYRTDDLDSSWCKIFIRVFKKREAKCIPLPRVRGNLKPEPALLFPQLMQYIAQTNYKNLWKEAYKKYNAHDTNKSTPVTLMDYNDVLREIIVRTYGCQIINTYDCDASIEESKEFDVHSNIFPAVAAVETLNAIFVIYTTYLEHNLYDCVTFSPSILDDCYTKPLFLIYQLLNSLKALHERSLTIGDITLNDIYLNEDLWIQIFPQLNSNIYVQDLPVIDNKLNMNVDCRKSSHKFDNLMKCVYCGMKTYDKVQVTNESLEKLCELWVNGQISNYTYLMSLNNLSGRRFGDPNCHYVFPWVTDFSLRCGKMWRDFKKSKFRLNKGDRQLDLTYEHSQQNRVPHHVSDVLSSITYYVYMARRTPKTVLCRNVRTIWVPAEYPSSIQRLQEWTPDECIPEFFADPTIFKSIHDDLDDLEVPNWCTCPEDFIEKHREALESQYVSERLHQWIDLTFGYKLSGNAAIKAKNVCLHLVDGHKNLTDSGVVQLFMHPHPQRATHLPFWSKTPPKVYFQNPHKSKSRDNSASSNIETSRSEEEDFSNVDDDLTLAPNSRSPLVISRFLSRSRSSLVEDNKDTTKRNTRSASLGPKNPSFTSHVTLKKTTQLVGNTSLNTGIITLPKEFNPAQALSNLENLHAFYTKTFHTQDGKKYVTSDNPISKENNVRLEHSIQNAFTNRLFETKLNSRATKSFTFPIDNQNILPFRSRSRPSSASSTSKIENQINCNYTEIIAMRRTRELQILGCLIVEIFLQKQLRSLRHSSTEATATHACGSFKARLKSCLTIVSSCRNDIPPCIRTIIDLLLQPTSYNLDDFKYVMMTEFGLPPPTAHLLLEPLLNNLIPFNDSFPQMYTLVASLKQFENIFDELNILYHFDCNGQMCNEFESVERTKILVAQNLGECKVKACAKYLHFILQNLNTTKDAEIIGILTMHIKRLIEDGPTAVFAAWYLFDPISCVLGQKASGEILLQPILKLFENDTDCNLPYNSRIAKLYHHSFLLRLMVRFGLRCFLEHFIPPLVEAVGGYRDYDKVDCILHTHSEKSARKTSYLKSIDNEQRELSPSDDSSESDKDKLLNTSKVEQEVFEFEEQDDEPIKSSIIEHLELNIANDLPFDHSTAEEALDVSLHENLEQLQALDELDLNLSEESNELKSPTIPIPSSSFKQKELLNISCDVGSKKSENEFISSENQHSINSTYSTLRGGRSKASISCTSKDSLIWLSHRLGPVLTAKYLSRNLLKMLTLCYVGKENLLLQPNTEQSDCSLDNLNIACSRVVGDANAVNVLECLTNIAALYGHQFILYQYLPHMSELLTLCKRKLTLNLEGGLISCLALLKHIIPFISDATLMENLQDVILKNILYPTIRLLGSTKYSFPNGAIARNVLARKYLDTLYVLSVRIGADMTKRHLAVPALQRFFLIFDKISENGYYGKCFEVNKTLGKDSAKVTDDSHFVEVRRDGTTAEWAIGGRPIQISHVRLRDSDSTDSLSPPAVQNNAEEPTINQALEELQAVFTNDLAHTAYIPFLKQIGRPALESALKNHTTIYALCQQYEEELKKTYNKLKEQHNLVEQSKSEFTSINTGSIGSNIALIGNRIDVQEDQEVNVLSFVSNRIENNVRHLRGNWLAYWEHEIGRSDKDTMFNFKQIKLQTFVGHTHGIKSLCTMDNENSFLSGSRDKTIKLWSLRSQGDGAHTTTCQSTYAFHKKSVLAINFMESLRLIASCDSVVHLWDPFMVSPVAQLESPKYAPVNMLKSLPAPSSLIFAATTEGLLKVIDAKTCSYIHELKVSVNANGLIRCLAVAPTGNWIAAGQSSGQITILDTRTGLVLATWRAHESDIIQLIALNEDTLISSSLDQNVGVWNVHDGRFKFYMNLSLPRGASEPVHCLNVYNNELISGTTANRIGVHTSIDSNASFSSTKLRSDAFKGLLTAMAILPLNRLLLLGADSGNIHLLC